MSKEVVISFDEQELRRLIAAVKWAGKGMADSSTPNLSAELMLRYQRLAEKLDREYGKTWTQDPKRILEKDNEDSRSL